MADHNETGKTGEEMAVQWLKEKGYEILHTNWRYGQNEIDIIAKKGRFLHFVEVKSRNYSPFGHPEDSVTKKKFKSIQFVADAYLQHHPGHAWIQYDIVAITFFRNRKPEYFLIEDVYL